MLGFRQRFRQRHGQLSGRRGFTLVELAIVVAIAGLLFAGLWRLLSSGSGQLTEQAAAQQMQQLAASVRGFLASSQGQTWLQNMGPTDNNAFILPLPADRLSTTCSGLRGRYDGTPANLLSVSSFCDFLQPGFVSGTTNPYGQFYEIRVRKTTGAVGQPAGAYEFLIVTRGGDTIPDSQGGRIASFMGADGGFIYTNVNTCGTPINRMACGAFGGYAVNIDDYVSIPDQDFTSQTAGGRITSRTYISSEFGSGQPWLARLQVPGDTARVFNTAVTRIDFGAGSNLVFGSGGALNGAAVTSGFALGSTNSTSTLTLSNTSTTTLPDGSTGPSPVLTVTLGSIVAQNSTIFVNAISGLRYVYSSSDSRLKTDITPLDKQLDKLLRLQTVHFKWKSDGQPSIGFVAEDVAREYPELVAKSTGGYQAVQYDKMIVPIVAALHELKAENQELRNEIKKLKSVGKMTAW